ncbi:hypothetical protein LBMAG38_21100 [Chloroflexota bacterium]|nr:hypothetical protein LBMAG38_21100 [Chloroflexota bacterium]
MAKANKPIPRQYPIITSPPGVVSPIGRPPRCRSAPLRSLSRMGEIGVGGTDRVGALTGDTVTTRQSWVCSYPLLGSEPFSES